VGARAADLGACAAPAHPGRPQSGLAVAAEAKAGRPGGEHSRPVAVARAGDQLAASWANQFGDKFAKSAEFTV